MSDLVENHRSAVERLSVTDAQQRLDSPHYYRLLDVGPGSDRQNCSAMALLSANDRCESEGNDRHGQGPLLHC